MRSWTWKTLSVLSVCCVLLASGCRSPYHADRGALFGGLTGAGVGAIVGDAVGNAGAGAALGAGVGSLTGAAVGSSLDEIEARNRAQIEAQLGHPVRPGGATVDDIVAMTHAGVSERVMATHVKNNGVARPLGAEDLKYLTSQGVPEGVIQAMQSPPPPRRAAVPSRPVIIEEHHYGPPPIYYRHYRRHHRRPRTTWGFSFSS